MNKEMLINKKILIFIMELTLVYKLEKQKVHNAVPMYHKQDFQTIKYNID